jgi:hypothetical protein
MDRVIQGMMKMRYLRIVILTTLALLPVISVVSQGGPVATYAWEEGDLALVYPADWDEPLPGEVEGRPVLSLAQAFVASPELRPPGIPIISLTVIRDLSPEESFDPDLYGFLEAALREEGVIAVGPVTTTVMDIEAVMTTGTSADGLHFGTGRAVQMLDDNILLVTGRGLAEQRDSLIETFEQVVNSLVQGAGIEPELPGYGVLWYTERGPADGEDAFLEFVAMTLGLDNTL